MCAYKLVKCEFKWWGLQTRVEKLIVNVSKILLQILIYCEKGGGRSYNENLRRQVKERFNKQVYF